MRRIALLLVLIVAPLFATYPAIADTDDGHWRIAVLASNAKTRVDLDAHYCLMPASMPIRPGNNALLRNTENDTIVTAEFYDPVEITPNPERYRAGEQCRLIALFPPVAPRDGLRILVKPYPRPVERSASLRVNIGVSVTIPEPFDWWYDEFGNKRCKPLEDVQLGHDSPVVTIPEARVQDASDARAPRLNSNVFYDEARAEEDCSLIARLDFPIADEYVIELGGKPQAENAD